MHCLRPQLSYSTVFVKKWAKSIEPYFVANNYKLFDYMWTVISTCNKYWANKMIINKVRGITCESDVGLKRKR